MLWDSDCCGCGKWSLCCCSSYLFVLFFLMISRMSSTFTMPLMSIARETWKFSAAVESIAAIALTAGVASPFQIRLRQLQCVFVSVNVTSNLTTSLPMKLVNLLRLMIAKLSCRLFIQSIQTHVSSVLLEKSPIGSLRAS